MGINQEEISDRNIIIILRCNIECLTSNNIELNEMMKVFF